MKIHWNLDTRVYTSFVESSLRDVTGPIYQLKQRILFERTDIQKFIVLLVPITNQVLQVPLYDGRVSQISEAKQ
jgi:hypothetical protein